MMVDHGVAECNDKKEKRRHWQECCKGDEHSTLLILQPSVRLQNKLEFAVRKVMRRTKLEERGKGSRVSATVKKKERGGNKQSTPRTTHPPPLCLSYSFTFFSSAGWRFSLSIRPAEHRRIYPRHRRRSLAGSDARRPSCTPTSWGHRQQTRTASVAESR